MRFVLSIAEAVRERVLATHGDVISRVLDELENRITDAEQRATVCSYGAALADYTWMKVSIHHCKRKLCDGLDSANTFRRLELAERRIRALSFGMYSKVCMECPACLSRRKAWPGDTMFAPHRMNQDGDILIFRREEPMTTADFRAAYYNEPVP